jgi:hypothetical protein
MALRAGRFRAPVFKTEKSGGAGSAFLNSVDLCQL